MKKTAFIFSFFSLFSLFFVSILQATRVNPRVGRSLWGIVRDSTPTPIENLDESGGIITINNSGSYQLYEDITYQIKILAGNVTLDLNGRNVASGNAGQASIEVGAFANDIDDVRIFNGSVGGIGFAGIYCTAFNTYTLSNLLVENVSVSGNDVGVRLQSATDGIAKNCSFINIDVLDNNLGFDVYDTSTVSLSSGHLFQNCRAFGSKVRAFALNAVNKTLFKDCQVYEMVVDPAEDPSDPLRSAGFVLFESSENVLDGCQVIEMEAEESVFAFKSEGCSNNLFENCTVKKIITTAEDFCNKAHGFLLTATEEKTKIIDCVVNEVDMTSTVSAVSYGIYLAPVIEYVETPSAVFGGNDVLLELIDDYVTTDSFAQSIAWSPDSRYIAAGGSYAAGGFVAVYGFDGQLLSLIDAPWVPLSLVEAFNTLVFSVDWSPDGNFIVAGDNDSHVSVFEFDGSSLLLTYSLALSASAQNVKWSPDGRCIVAGNDDGFSVLSFDANKTLNKVADFALSNAGSKVDWSPDQRYIVVTAKRDFYVFNFDGRNLILLDSLLATSTNFTSLEWLPNGKFLAAARSAAADSIFFFDGTNLYTTGITIAPTTQCKWSPDGNYLAYGYRNLGGSPGRHVQVEIFSGTSLTPLKWRSNFSSNDDVFGLAWSTCGKYIATTSIDWNGGLPLEGDSALRVFKGMYGPENCLVRGCSVCDAAAYETFVGTGIMGAGTNCFFDNISCNNQVDFSFGIPNVFYGKHNDHQPFDNVATQRPNFLVKDAP